MSSFQSRLKSCIRHNPIYTACIRPLHIKINDYIDSKLSDEDYFIRRHKRIFGYTPDFRNPQTFNEKIVHRILFDRNPVYTALADKLKARIYIATILSKLTDKSSLSLSRAREHKSTQEANTSLPAHFLELNPNDILQPSSPLFAPIDELSTLLLSTNDCPYLPKLYGIYHCFDEIDFDKLTRSFVIKTNHDDGGVVIVPNKEQFLSNSKTFQAGRKLIIEHLQTNWYDMYRGGIIRI